jgi:hypothetical protein
MVIPTPDADYDGSLLSADSIPAETEPKVSGAETVAPAMNDVRARRRRKLWIALSVASLLIVVLAFITARILYKRGSLADSGRSEQQVIGKGRLSPVTPLRAEEVRARSFVVVDDNHKPLAELGGTGAGGPAKGVRLRFFDKKGEPCLWIGFDETSGPRLTLLDKTGKERFGLCVADPGVSLGLMDENGKECACIVAGNSTDPALHVVGFTVKDGKGKVRAVLALQGAESRFLLFDKDGSQIPH